MIKNLNIYTDLNDDKTYAYCTYDLIRCHKKHIENFRIDLFYTERETDRTFPKAGQPIYDVEFKQTILSDFIQLRHRSEPIVFHRESYGYDMLSILEVVGDTREHRDFLSQVGFNDQ